MRPQAVDQIGADGTLLSRCGDVKSVRHVLLSSVKVELVALGFFLAFLPAGIALLLDRSEVLAGDVSGDVHPIETRRFKLRELRVDRAHRKLQRLEILVDDRVSADLARDLLLVAAGGDELGARRHVDTVHIGKPHRRRR